MKLSLGTIGIGLSILVMLQFMIFNEGAVDGPSQASSLSIIFAILVFVAGTFTFKFPCVGGLIFTVAAFLGLCCTNLDRDSRWESSMIAGGHEQLGPYEVQDQELAFVQYSAEATRIAVDLV